MKQSSLSSIEREIIILFAIWEMIDDMVNFAIFSKNEEVTDTEVRFQSEGHQRLFNILLSDFLSQPNLGALGLLPPGSKSVIEQTHLSQLEAVIRDPCFNSDASKLKIPTEQFISWLETDTQLEHIWFPSLQVSSGLTVQRLKFLKICGDISKHSFTRLDLSVKRIVKLLAENNISITTEQGYGVLSDFYDWFHSQALSYHASTIAAHLNDIRWGIFEYLRPEFNRSYKPDFCPPLALQTYSFIPPENCTAALPRSLHWKLMERVRKEPWFPRFTVNPILQKRS